MRHFYIAVHPTPLPCLLRRGYIYLLFGVFFFVFHQNVLGQNSSFQLPSDTLYYGDTLNLSPSVLQSGITYTWYTGDGGSYSNVSIQHIYAQQCTTQTVEVKLVAQDNLSLDSTSHTLVLIQNLPIPELADVDIFTPFSNCDNSPSLSNPDFSITLSNTTTNSGMVDHYTIDWGDNSGLQTYTNASFPISHTYSQLGLFNLTVTATDASGCTKSNSYSVANQSNPAVGLSTFGNTQGCSPQTFNFTLSQFQNNSPGTYYVWDFGDGSPTVVWDYNQPYVDNSISHVFDTTSCTQSNYFFTVSVTAYNHCDQTTATVGNIRIYSAPKAQFVSSTDTACVGSAVSFSNQTISGFGYSCNSLASYAWNFGDPNASTSNPNTASTIDGSHVYSQTGTYAITLEASNNICGSSSDTQWVVVNELPHAVGSISEPNGCIPSTATFTNNSTGGNLKYTWTISPSTGWNFINGTHAHSIVPEISFGTTGTFNVQLRAENNCGYDDTTFTYQAQDAPLLSLSTPPDACGSVTLSPNASIDAYGSPITDYNWTFSSNSTPVSSVAQPLNIAFANQQLHSISLEIQNACGSATDTVFFEVFPIPNVSASGSASQICYGDTLNLEGFGASAYQWLPSSSLSQPSANLTQAFPTQSTQYILNGTDTNGCSNTDTVDVIVNALPNVLLSTNTPIICIDDTAGIQVSGAQNYQWIAPQNILVNNGSSILIQPQLSSYVMVKGTDGNGCMNHDSLFIQVQTAPQITLSDSLFEICEGQQALLGAGGGNSYSWSPSTGLSSTTLPNPVANPAQSTTYTLESYSSAGCKSDTTLVVKVMPLPNVITTPQSTSMCQGEQAQILASGASVYSWTDQNGTPIGSQASVQVSPISSQTFYVEGTDVNGCTEQDSVLITVHSLPAVQIAAPAHEICYGDSLLLQGSGASSYEWLANGSLLSTVDSLTTAPLMNQDYALVGTDGNNCHDTVYYHVQVHPLPILSSNHTQITLCEGDSVQVLLGGAQDYQWLPGVQGNTNGSQAYIFGDSSVTYNIVGTDLNGCKENIQIPVAVNALPVIQAVAQNNNLCLGQSTQLSASGGQSYQWSPATNLNATNGSLVTATPSFPITYIVSGTDGNGCTARDTVALYVSTQLNIQVTADDYEICNGDTVNLSAFGADTYQWNPANGIQSNSGYQVQAIPNVSTQYIVTGTDTNGCISTNSVYIQVNSIPAVAATANNMNVCIGDSSVLSTNGGLSYEWTDLNSGTQHQGASWTVYPVANTSYKLLGTDANGCSDVDFIDLYAEALPQLQISSTKDSLCFGESVQLNASGAQSYSWSYNGTTVGGVSLVHAPVQDLWYKVDGLSNFGCKSSDSLFVTVLSLPQIQSGATQIDLCYGDSAQVSLSGANAFSFSPGSGISYNAGYMDIHTLSTTQYLITGTDAFGCSNTKQMTVDVRPLPHADFHVDTLICLNSTYTFSNQSTGASAFMWHFGDGSVSSLGTPAHSYGQTNYYPVQLKATSPYGCVDSIQKTTQVIAAPVVQFSTYPNQGCGPLNVQLSNNTSGLYVDYQWNFGNGVFSTLAHPGTATFNAGALADTNYVIEMTASNLCGSLTIADTIVVHPGPKSNFGYSLNTNCSPAMATFANASTGLATSYLWDLGDNTSSNAVVPTQHTYHANATAQDYIVRLISYNNCGTDTLSKTITVQPNTVQAFFTPSSTNACAPANIQFANFSNINNSANWDFGDGNFSSNISPTHTFTQPGTYQVQLIVTDNCGIDTALANIVVQSPPQLSYVLNHDTLCQGESIQLQNTTTGLGGLQWLMGDGATYNTNTILHQYNSPGTYEVKMIGQSQNQICTDTSHMYILVNPKATSSISTNDPDGCEPFTTTFQALTDNTNYLLWNFDDGSTSVASSPSHTFMQAGSYNVSLITNNFYNCPDTSVMQIKAYPKPQSDFSIPPAAICNLPADIQLSNLSTGAVAYNWNLGNGITSTQIDPLAHYDAAGNYTVELIARTAFNCMDTSMQSFAILPPPKADFSTSTKSTCALSGIEFFNHSLDATHYEWHFGDGNQSQSFQPLHVYQGKGTYDIMLIAYNNNSCSDTMLVVDSIVIHPIPDLDFGWHHLYQDNESRGLVQFENRTVDADMFYWDFDDGMYSTETHPLHQFSTHGVYNVQLIADNSFGCTMDTTLSVRIDLIKGLYIPNAIAPEHPNPELNVFKPAGQGLAEYEIIVFDQWGNQVWRSTALTDGQPAEAWDGTKDGMLLPAGSYLWKAHGVFEDGSIWQGNKLQNSSSIEREGILRMIR